MGLGVQKDTLLAKIMLEIDFFRNSSQKNVGVLKVIFVGLGA